ncbi:MAG: hypothetical protein KatS3mg023_0587 [Armatimonadota bacterium]|nr:MAG: hypothetical protein KatS3mg023_0587 [Armatimonadota bacterium]
MAINFDSSLYATAVGQWLSENFEPQFARLRSVFAKLQTDGAIKVGGAYLLAPVSKDKNPSVQGVANFASAMSIPADQGVGAQYNWSWYEGLTAINKAEEMATEGEAAMVDLLESRLNETIASFVEVVNTDLFSTTDASQSKIAGLPYALDTTGSFGGIDRSTNTWWQAQNESAVGAVTLAKINRMYNKCQSRGGTPPSLIVMPEDIFGSYESLLQASQQFVKDGKLADLGFTAYLHKGATVLFDNACPAGTVLYVNTRHTYLVAMSKQPDAVPVQFPDRPVKGYLHTWAIALVSRRLNANGRQTGVTP